MNAVRDLIEAAGVVGGLWFLLIQVQIKVFRLRMTAAARAPQGAPLGISTKPPKLPAHQVACLHCGKIGALYTGGACTAERERDSADEQARLWSAGPPRVPIRTPK